MTNNDDLKIIYVYPDGEIYDEPPYWKSDDYEVRKTNLCSTCNTELYVHYREPLASCDCGTTEWYY